MEISDEEIKKGVELCFNNARSLIEDAETLLNQRSYGHSLFLTISAIEEMSKAFMYACGRVDVWKPEELVHDVLHHTPKYTLFVISILIDSINKAIEKGDYRITKPLDIDDFVELGKDLEFAINEIWKQRLQSLYVDLQQGKWLSPSDFKKFVGNFRIFCRKRKLDEEEVEGVLYTTGIFDPLVRTQARDFPNIKLKRVRI